MQSTASEISSQATTATTKPAAPVTKSELQAAFHASRSPVVQNAIIEWNKFNKIVRTLTRSTKVQKLILNYYIQKKPMIMSFWNNTLFMIKWEEHVI